MKKLYQGKTKDVFEVDDAHVLLRFKDDVTGKDGVFDPGENQVGLSIEGQGNANLVMSAYFFKKFEEAGIPTHMVSIENNDMVVRKATAFGEGLEVICRYKATGSFMRRYGSIAKEFQGLDGYIEFTLKDDDRNDPLITREGLVLLGVLSEEEVNTLVTLTRQVSDIIFDVCKDKGLDLIDLKLEFGRDVETNKIILIDEISSGNMRVYKDNKMVDSLELPTLLGV